MIPPQSRGPDPWDRGGVGEGVGVIVGGMEVGAWVEVVVGRGGAVEVDGGAVFFTVGKEVAEEIAVGDLGAVTVTGKVGVVEG